MLLSQLENRTIHRVMLEKCENKTQARGRHSRGSLVFQVRTLFVEHIESELPESQLQVFLQIPEQIGLSDFLIQHPLQTIRFEYNIVFDGREVNGLYEFLTREASVNLSRQVFDCGQPYQKQKFSSISVLAEDTHLAIGRTFVHELGHHVHCILREQDLSLFRMTMLTPRSDSLSQYGLINPLEYFAESFAAYVFQRLELLIDDPFGHATIDRVLARLALNIKESP